MRPVTRPLRRPVKGTLGHVTGEAMASNGKQWQAPSITTSDEDPGVRAGKAVLGILGA